MRPWKLPSNARTLVASGRGQLMPAQRDRLLVGLGARRDERDVRQAGHELAQRRSRTPPPPRSRRARCRRSRPACRRTRPRRTRARPDPRRSRRRPSRSGSCRRARPAARRRSTPSTGRRSAGDRTPAASSPSARDRRRRAARATARSRAGAAARAMDRHRARLIDERARRLGGLLGRVLRLEPIEIERAAGARASCGCGMTAPSDVLEHRDRRDDVAVRPRAGRPVVAALADAAERQLRAGEVGRAVLVQDARVRVAARTARTARARR